MNEYFKTNNGRIGNILRNPATYLLFGTVAVFGYLGYEKHVDDPLNRTPPEDAVCTIVHLDDGDSIQDDADKWFEGSGDIIIGKYNIQRVTRREMTDNEMPDGSPDETYAVCDYNATPYPKEGSKRHVVNPDNIGGGVTVVTVSEFPQSPSVG